MKKLYVVKEELIKVIEKEVQDYTDAIYREGYKDGIQSSNYNRPCRICKYHTAYGCEQWQCEWERMRKESHEV